MRNWSLLRTTWFQRTLKESISTSVHRLQSCFQENHGKQINLDAISKQEAPPLLEHFFLEIRQTTKENKGKEYETRNITNLPQWFTKVLFGASMSTSSRQFRPWKIYRDWVRRSFNVNRLKQRWIAVTFPCNNKRCIDIIYIYIYIYYNFSRFKVTNLHRQMNLKFRETNHRNFKPPRKYLLRSARYVSPHAFRKLSMIKSH